MDATSTQPKVAYFCMEFALHEDLPIYAGGLGVLAGDYLKSAGENGRPIAGIGILWQQGYTRQLLGADGHPFDQYPALDNSRIQDIGARVRVDLRGRSVICRVSRVDCYGNAPLYLLDTNLPENEERWLTDRLYAGGTDERIAQEMILGVAGVRALRVLGLPVEIFHFNEGHAVLAGLELIREKMNQGFGFHEAWRQTRRQIVFTTHTPVPEGNEAHHFGALHYAGANCGLTDEQLREIGGEPFNMTIAGLRLARKANAVSQLHAETARQMWREVRGAAPIVGITNGVHQGTWQDPQIARAFAAGEDLLAPHQQAKQRLLQLIAARNGVNLYSDALLIGFARRAAPYKRGDLILSRLDLIEPYLADGRLQLIFSGKAHPLDGRGKDIIAGFARVARQHPESVVFLEDYDLALGKALTRGCDVWLNTPRRPMEASGTSGMKAAMNGVLNLSVLDGWWPEGCRHGANGWRIGDGACGPNQDGRDGCDLYGVLLNEVIPVFEDDRARWHAMMRASIEMAKDFSSSRMLDEYFSQLYEENNLEEEIA